MILATERLKLRIVEATDSAAMWPTVSLPDFPRFMSWNAHQTLAETAGFVQHLIAAHKAGTAHTFAILHDGSFVGLIGLHDITRMMRAWQVDRAEMGYWIAPAYQNRGFVTEAGRRVMRFGFEELGLQKITIGCVTDNAPSRRVIEKLGFRLLGVQRHHFFRFDRWWDHLFFELCADEFSAQSL